MISFKQFLIETTGEFDEPPDAVAPSDRVVLYAKRMLRLIPLISTSARRAATLLYDSGVKSRFGNGGLMYGDESTSGSGDVQYMHSPMYDVRDVLRAIVNTTKLPTKGATQMVKMSIMEPYTIHMNSIPPNIASQVNDLIQRNQHQCEIFMSGVPFIVEYLRQALSDNRKATSVRLKAAKQTRDSVMPDDMPIDIKPNTIPSSGRLVLTSPRDQTVHIRCANPLDLNAIFIEFAHHVGVGWMLIDKLRAEYIRSVRQQFESNVMQYDGPLDKSGLFGLLRLAKRGSASARLKTLLVAVTDRIGDVDWRVMYSYVPGGLVPGENEKPFIHFTLVSANGRVVVTDDGSVEGFTAGKSTYHTTSSKVVEFLFDKSAKSNPMYKTIKTDLTSP